MTDPIEPMTWWSPAGFQQNMPTPALVAVRNGEEDWNAAMQNAGYGRSATMGSSAAETLEVWTHEDGHLYIDVVDQTTFLVARENSTAFWVTLFPSLQATQLDVRRTEALELQAKAFVAWVRRGHGLETISEYGFTRDDDLRWQEDMRRRAAQAKPKA